MIRTTNDPSTIVMMPRVSRTRRGSLSLAIGIGTEVNLLCLDVQRPFANEGPMLLEIYAGLFRGVKAHHLLAAPAQLAGRQPDKSSSSNRGASGAQPHDASARHDDGARRGTSAAGRSSGDRASSEARGGQIGRDPLRDARQVWIPKRPALHRLGCLPETRVGCS